MRAPFTIHAPGDNGTPPRRDRTGRSAAVAGARRALTRYAPGVGVAITYRARWALGDIGAGIALAALVVPLGIAYGELAGLPPGNGLYATLVPLVAYALVGPSRILVLGPDSAIAPLVAATIVPLAGPDVGARIAFAGILALIVGGASLLAGLLRFGFLADLISKPVRLGYLMGVAATVTVGQTPSLLGYSVGRGSFAEDVRGLVSGLGRTSGVTLAIGVTALLLIQILGRLWPRSPGVLIALVVTTVLVHVFSLSGRVDVIGSFPTGLPSFAIPHPPGGHWSGLVVAALGIALLAIADTTVLSRSYAARHGDEIDPNRELTALGLANIATGLFHGFPVSGSASRTPVVESAGARTQLAGLVAAGALAIVLVTATGLLHDLPTAALAAIVISAVLRIVDTHALRQLARVNRPDFALALTSFLGVAVFGVVVGIAIALALSIAAFFWRAWHPHDAILGRVDGMKGYHDLSRHPGAREIPGLVLLRFDAPLFFANTGVFRERARHAVRRAHPPARWLVVAAEPITDVDSTAAEMLIALDEELQLAGVELAFAEMKDPVHDQLRRYGIHERIGHEKFFPTTGAAVHAYLAEHDVDWQDWEDDASGAGPH